MNYSTEAKDEKNASRCSLPTTNPMSTASSTSPKESSTNTMSRQIPPVTEASAAVAAQAAAASGKLEIYEEIFFL